MIFSRRPGQRDFKRFVMIAIQNDDKIFRLPFHGTVIANCKAIAWSLWVSKNSISCFVALPKAFQIRAEGCNQTFVVIEQILVRQSMSIVDIVHGIVFIVAVAVYHADAFRAAWKAQQPCFAHIPVLREA